MERDDLEQVVRVVYYSLLRRYELPTSYCRTDLFQQCYLYALQLLQLVDSSFSLPQQKAFLFKSVYLKALRCLYIDGCGKNRGDNKGAHAILFTDYFLKDDKGQQLDALTVDDHRYDLDFEDRDELQFLTREMLRWFPKSERNVINNVIFNGDSIRTASEKSGFTRGVTNRIVNDFIHKAARVVSK